jgi:hypothetical protein
MRFLWQTIQRMGWLVLFSVKTKTNANACPAVYNVELFGLTVLNLHLFNSLGVLDNVTMSDM